MADHRVSLHALSLRRYEDPAQSRDPRVRAVVAGLQTLDPAPAPRAHFRAELRAQLVAVAPRLIADGITAEGKMIDIVPKAAADGVAVAPQAARAARITAGLRRIPIARPLGVAATLITVFALLLGGAVYMSRNALPGDTLYGLKRASENFRYAIAGSDQERANLLLDYAGTRVDEAQGLLDRASASATGSGVTASGLSDHTAQLIDSNLASADGDVRNAARLLGTNALKFHNPRSLATMTRWAPGQLSRLHRLANAMPAGVLRARTTRSTQLVHAALHRAETLQTRVHCGARGSDQLGPVPAACGGGGAGPGPVTRPSKHRHHHHRQTGGSAPASGPVVPATLGSSQPPAGHQHGGSGPATEPVTPTTSKPPITLPPVTLPNGLPTLSPGLTLTECDLGIGLGIVQIDLNTCLLLHGTPHK